MSELTGGAPRDDDGSGFGVDAAAGLGDGEDDAHASAAAATIAGRRWGGGAAVDDAAPEQLLHELRGASAAPMMVAASLAWGITVAPAAFARGVPLSSAFFAVVALAAALAGPPFLRLRPRLARHVGISLFLGASTASWLAGSMALHPARLDPTRGVFGAIAWGVFALAWSERWTKGAVTAPRDPDAPLLLARSNLPFLASPIAASGVAAAIALLSFAFGVRDPERGLAAQVAALLGSVLMVSAAATVAVARGAPRSPAGRKVTPRVVRALLLLVAFSVAGAVVAALR